MSDTPDPSDPRPSRPAFTRRQFGVLFVGGAAVVAAGSNLVAATTALDLSGGTSPARTSFGTVTIERAKRLARFATTSSSVVTVAATGDGGGGHDHGPSVPVPSGPWREPVNATWADVVVLWLAVENLSGRPVHLSPGQLRLRIGGDGPTVTPRNADTPRLEIPPRATASTWVSYLAPAAAGPGFLAEFTDPALDRALTLALPTAIAVAEARNDAEPWAA